MRESAEPPGRHGQRGRHQRGRDKQWPHRNSEKPGEPAIADVVGSVRLIVPAPASRYSVADD